MKFNVMCAILAVVFVFGPGCVSTGNGDGVELIENMDQDRFDNVLGYIETGVRVAATQLLQRTDVSAEILTAVANALEDTANKDAVTVVGGILSDVADRVLTEFNVPGEAIVAGLRLVEDQVNFGDNLNEDGSFPLSDRTKELINAVAQGIHDGVDRVTSGLGPDPESANPKYAEYVRAAWLGDESGYSHVDKTRSPVAPR
jgi:hypothetical protein